MEKAKKKKRLYLLLTSIAAGAALLFTAAAIIFLVNTLYVAAIIFAVVSAGGYYTAVFSLFALWDAYSAIRIIPFAEKYGADSLSEIADAMKWKENSAAEFIEKCKKAGYIS